MGRKAEIIAICQRYKVIRLEAFGSAARGTDFDPVRSDVNFLVEFKPLLVPGLFERKIDLIRDGTIRNPYRKASIDEDRELVFEA